MGLRIGSPPPAGAVADLVDFVAGSIRKAPEARTPFFHLLLRDFFPDDIYAAMIAAMPGAASYRGMSGRSKSARRPDGTPTRVKVDLFPEFIRHFPTGQRGIWRLVGTVLRSRAIQAAFADRLAADIERRFGAGFDRQRCYAVPILTRDVAGYSIPPHTDTHWKAITVQICLPPSSAIAHVGTVFHERLATGELRRAAQVPFAPNAGYAFAVGDRTWHSADVVGSEVMSRDSILLTYFVDSGALAVLRNRSKRVGNLLLAELRHLGAR
jgi:hypothetical protein